IGLIRPIKSINSKFLFYWILNPETKKIADEVATGTAQKTVSLKSLRNFTITIPSLAEQTAIVSRLDALSAKISDLKAKYRRQIECCDELRQSLLRAAFEGEM
ncbi:MAG: restriction endonuclease subunit S, partial [Bacteroidales bacterium]|nr:restriction endonuclease subunit S [Bacteroidales bacterium]